MTTLQNGFPGVPSIESLHTCDPAEGAPLPEVPVGQRPLVTFRVVVSATGRALRRGYDPAPRFGESRLFPDSLAEFTTEDAASWALWFVQNRTAFDRSVRLEVVAHTHPNLTPAQEAALFCAVRDTAAHQAFADWRLTEARHRGLAGLPPMATKGGW